MGCLGGFGHENAPTVGEFSVTRSRRVVNKRPITAQGRTFPGSSHAVEKHAMRNSSEDRSKRASAWRYETPDSTGFGCGAGDAESGRSGGANHPDVQSHHLAGVGFHHAQSSIAMDTTIHLRAKRDGWRVGEKNRARDIVGDPLQIVRQADYGREGCVFFPASP